MRWYRRGAVAIVLVIVAVTVGLAVVSAGGDGERIASDVDLSNWGGGAALAVPGQITGIGAIKLKAARGASYRLVGWRFRKVVPADTRVVYAVRPFPHSPDCPGGHIDFEADAVSARTSDRREDFPCEMHRPDGRDVLDERHGYELIAIFWAAPKQGVRMLVSDPVVLLERDGRVYRTEEAPFDQEYCVLGGRACVRPMVRGWGFTRAEAIRKIEYVCHAPQRPPLFASPENRPPRPRGVERGHDVAGRPCTVPPAR